jgi:sRNA-binding protein
MSKRKCHDAAAATIVLLAERFPNCFRLHDPRRPLKTGIHHDIHLALEGAITPRELRLGAAQLFPHAQRRVAYWSRRPAGRRRRHRRGSATREGDKLAAIKAKRRTAALVMKPKGTEPSGRAIMGRPDKSDPTPEPSAPKRHSLADLREAARRRREQQETAA